MAILAGWGALGTLPDAGAAAATCKPRGYVVEAKTRAAVVVRRRHTARVYGCLRSRGKRVRLWDAIEGYALARPFVAYHQSYSDPGGSTTFRVVVRSLATGFIRRGAAAYVPQPSTQSGRDGETPATVTDIAVDGRGSAAWISCTPEDPNESACSTDADAPIQVWRSDRRGRKLVDSSAAIRLRSLRREGSRISWRRGETRRRATLR